MKKNKLIIIALVLIILLIYFILFYFLMFYLFQNKNETLINNYIEDKYIVNDNCFVNTRFKDVLAKDNELFTNNVTLISCYAENLEITKSLYFVSEATFIKNNRDITLKTFKNIKDVDYFEIKNDIKKLEKSNYNEAKEYFKR